MMPRASCRVLLVAVLLLVLVADRPVEPAGAGVRHPHLLLSADDPFTGLPALQARYAAGQRPSDDVCGDALTWLITNDRAAAERAVGRIRQERPPQKVGSRSYAAYVCWSLAFDWLYDYPGFDAALKDRLAGDLLAAGERMLDDVSLRDPDSASYQNYTTRYLALASFTLAAVRDHPSTSARATLLWPRVRRAFDNILDTAELVTPDGSYHESMDYMRITTAAMTLLAELHRTVDGDDPAWRAGLYRNIGRTYLYKLLPDGTSSREGDDEYPFPQRDDNVVLGYAVSRFKDPYAAWIQRESGWLPREWLVPVLQFLWSDPHVQPRDPRQAAATSSELPRHQWFRGVDHVILRDGWGPDATWIQFLAGPFFAKHQHLDRNAFTIYHRGYLAIDSGADYTETESPHYLNQYRRTIAHNTMLVYDPRERFFWGEDLWQAANDGGQRMDSSRYWNTIRSRDDWRRTRDIWDVAHVEAASFRDGQYQFVRGDATRAYATQKLSHFSRDLLYLPTRGLLAVFDRVRSTDPSFRKVWLLHGVDRPDVEVAGATGATGTAGAAGAVGGAPVDIGHGGRSWGAASTVTWRDGQGQLRVHPVLPRARDVVIRGGPGWDFWTPGDDRGGAWGSGQNWPLEPFAGGPLPSDPFLVRMWKTFWGQELERLEPSNSRHVVPGGWRMEVSPSEPALDDRFLHLLEIGDRDAHAPGLTRIEPLEGSRLAGAVAGDVVLLFAVDPQPPIDGEVTLPQAQAQANANANANAAVPREVYITGLQPNATYELQWTTLGIPKGRLAETADEGGVLHVSLGAKPAERLRLRLLTTR
jgi:hypothetical protein